MNNMNLNKVLIGGFVLMMSAYTPVLADDFECPVGYNTEGGGCTKSDTACDGNCTWVYDYKTQSLTYEGTGTIKYSTNTYGIGPIKNLTVGEGITGITQNTPATSTFVNIGSSDGKLVLPSTLRNVGGYAMYGLGFGTVEINSDNLSFASQSFRFAKDADVNIIMPASNNIRMSGDALYSGVYKEAGGIGATLHFQCRGGIPEQCGGGIQSALESFENAGGHFSSGFYEKYENGHLLEQWGVDGVKNYVYDESGHLVTYSQNGELVNSYTYGNDGSISIYDEHGKLIGIQDKRILTVDEATALVLGKGNKNTFSIKYR